MAVFTRSKNPFNKEVNYPRYREQVRKDFRECCSYCLMSELLAAGKENFQLDHFKPKSKFPHLKNSFKNIHYSCSVCNRFKWDHWPSKELESKGCCFVNFCIDNYSKHFREDAKGNWIPLTKAAEYTEEKLELNREHLIKIRNLMKDIIRLKGLDPINWDKVSGEISDNFFAWK